MGHIGIIAEYNPFHNGHAYQIDKIHTLYPDKGILAVISGDFVQRGEPAIYNKYLRTKSALACGCDIVFELPSLFATASAEHFASAAVLALAATGVVDTLCFGAEDDNLDDFFQIANLLVDEPEEYSLLLQSHLKNGVSYPKARALAVNEYFNNAHLGSLLGKPNNILGIEYIKAIIRYNLTITPVIIKRNGAGYHDTSTNTPVCSATALRTHIQATGFSYSLNDNMPAAVFKLLSQSIYANPLSVKHFYPMLQYALWEHKDNYNDYLEMNTEIANQLKSLNSYPSSFEGLVDYLTTKNQTSSRIRHALCNLLLGYTKQDMMLAKEQNYITYLRLLGFERSSSSILKEMKQTASVPIINKVTDAFRQLSGTQLLAFQKDIAVSTLYHHVFSNVYKQTMPSEYEHTVIIKDESHIL